MAWDVRKLTLKARSLEPISIPLSAIAELDEPFWFGPEGEIPTCRNVAEHARLMDEADLRYPIILDPQGRVMDGMHRVCKALKLGHDSVMAYRLSELPPPDFIGIGPDDLPYPADGDSLGSVVTREI